VDTLPVELNVNGALRTVTIEPRTLLVHALREHLGLTGTKIGCDTSGCGACTVLVDGKAMKSCTLLAVRAEGHSVTTIEGLAAPGGVLHPLQEAFRMQHGFQCGFCTPGMVMAALDLIERDPEPSDASVRHALAGNLCRCTGYHSIVESVQQGARAMSVTA
jgi:carbon-monoxide dehydrogenase small subunit